MGVQKHADQFQKLYRERFEENSNCRPIVNEIASIQGLAKINKQEELARTRVNQFSEKIKRRANFDENLKLNASFDNSIREKFTF